MKNLKSAKIEACFHSLSVYIQWSRIRVLLSPVAFFVNAAGGKESPVLIGKSKKPHCFLKLKDPSHPCGAHYFSNDKAWMHTENMTDILTKLNTPMKREGRNIGMFLDNAPYYSLTLKGMFSNIRVEFLPKSTTSCHHQDMEGALPLKAYLVDCQPN